MADSDHTGSILERRRMSLIVAGLAGEAGPWDRTPMPRFDLAIRGSGMLPGLLGVHLLQRDASQSLLLLTGEAQIAVAAARETPRLTIRGNRVAISSTPRPAAELTTSDRAQATR